jgi:hypothetical protein
MKKATFLLLFFGLCSCSNSDDTTTIKPPFFNLKTGNLWVYKRYSSSDAIHYTDDHFVDSVRVVGDSLLNGFTYSKIIHKETNDGMYLELLRVTADGHLINADNFVKHPGYDSSYQYIQNLNGGTATYHLIGNQNITVENHNYDTSPFIADYVPLLPQFPNHTLKYFYAPNTGLVLRHIENHPESPDIEYRLVYSELN